MDGDPFDELCAVRTYIALPQGDPADLGQARGQGQVVCGVIQVDWSHRARLHPR